MSSLSTLIVLMSTVVGQSGEATQQTQWVTTHEQLKVMEPLIGTWISESTAERDYPAVNVKKGEVTVTRAVFRWVTNKNGILLERSQVRKNGEVLYERRVQLIAWDAESEGIISFRIGPDGRHARDKWHQDGDGWIVDSSFVSPSGTRSTRKVRLTVQGDTLLRTDPASNELQEELKRVKKVSE
jgi:hypothetical protein